MSNDWLKLTHMLCARVCHDLAAPIGAVSMGVEMIQEEFPKVDKDSLEILGISTKSMLNRLALLRCLVGYAGAEVKPTFNEIKSLLNNEWSESKYKLVDKTKNPDDIYGPDARLLLAMILSAVEAIPRGGEISVHPDFFIEVKGVKVALMEEISDSLQFKSAPGAQSPRTIIPYFAAILGHEKGCKLSIRSYADKLQMTAIAA